MSSEGPEILAFAFNRLSIVFILNIKFQHEDSENMKTDREDTVVFNLHQIKQRNPFFLGGGGGHPVDQATISSLSSVISPNSVKYNITFTIKMYKTSRKK